MKEKQINLSVKLNCSFLCNEGVISSITNKYGILKVDKLTINFTSAEVMGTFICLSSIIGPNKIITFS
jgi:hypothetical protein